SLDFRCPHSLQVDNRRRAAPDSTYVPWRRPASRSLFQRLLHHRDLNLVHLEVDDLVRLASWPLSSSSASHLKASFDSERALRYQIAPELPVPSARARFAKLPFTSAAPLPSVPFRPLAAGCWCMNIR